MSLLNDALKRAEKVKPEEAVFAAVPAPERVTLSRRFVPRHSILPVLILGILLLAGFFLWQWHAGVVEVKARTRPMPAREEVKPKPAPTEPSPKTNLPAVATATSTNAAPPVPPVSNSIVHSLASALTLWKSATAPARQTEYKLQGIFFFPRRPSAVINGETVFIGDRVDQAVVKAIGTNSAILAISNGQTQVIELPQ
jgi:hypothetical protein